MENNRTHHIIKESGIALVSALIIVAASLLLIGGIYFLMGGSWKVAVINKKFTTTQEAAAGGAQHATEVVRLVSNEGSTANLGLMDAANATNVIYFCQSGQTQVRAKTSDGRYQIDMTISCLGQKPVPGSGAALVFPPPPSSGGGGGTAFFFYSIISEAKDTLDPQNISLGRVEAVYRYTR